jgi:hypothetical protein
MNMLEIIRNYFTAKLEGNGIEKAPKGVCPNCWGKQEWDGEFYKKIKAKNITTESNTYTSFIHEVVEKLDRIKLKEDTYICESCNISYKE